MRLFIRLLIVPFDLFDGLGLGSAFVGGGQMGDYVGLYLHRIPLWVWETCNDFMNIAIYF